MLRIPSEIKDEQFESLKIQDTTFVAYRSNVYPERNELFFEEPAVVVVLEGKKKFIAPHQDLLVHKGQILFFQRGCYFMNESLDNDYRSLVFFFYERLLKEFVSQNLSLFEGFKPKNSASILVFTATPTFHKFIDSLLPYFQAHTPLLNYFLRLKFQELLLHLLEIDTSQQLKTILFNIYQGQKLSLDYTLQNYYLKPLTLQELAHISGRSLSAFKREFQAKYNTSPALWIRQKRLEHAAFLLKNSPLSVNEISQEIGFESTSHFIKAFKEKYGTTPKKAN